MAEKGLSSYEVERRSLNEISQSQVSRIRNGQVTNPSPARLQALSKGLGVAEEEIFAVVRGKRANFSTLAQEKIESLIRKLERVDSDKREYALDLISLVEREFERLSKNN